MTLSAPDQAPGVKEMRNVLFCAIALSVLGCGGGGAGGSAQPTTRTRGTSNLITEAEINAAGYQNAFEVVQNLRPQMLIPRGTGSDATGTTAASIPIIVYMDDIRLGEPSSLASIPASRVREIRFMNARDATTRYGTGHSSGVILVTTKR
jgi:hypothetical protein